MTKDEGEVAVLTFLEKEHMVVELVGWFVVPLMAMVEVVLPPPVLLPPALLGS